jgi:predicted GNAT family acetyltransferase
MAAPQSPAGSGVRRHDRRYELEIDGTTVAFADYSEHGDVMTIPYIETAVEHRGNGYSSALMAGVVDDVRDRNISVRATCAVARAYIAANAPDVLVN